MAIEWRVKATELANCNCVYACPCQFSAPPDKGFCEASVAWHVDEGHFGDVRLDGLNAIALLHWPGPIHLGNGTMQLVIDERADGAQRDALQKIMTGQETDEMATMWWVYGAMSPNKREPLYAPISFELDVDARHGAIKAPGIVEITGRPIRSPVSGAEHRVRIDLPNGFEYRIAEIGSAATKTTSATAVALNLDDSYGQFARIHLSNKGVVEA